jgi:hypothetical protein
LDNAQDTTLHGRFHAGLPQGHFLIGGFSIFNCPFVLTPEVRAFNSVKHSRVPQIRPSGHPGLEA